MPHDPLDVIAESSRGMHESTQVIAQATLQMRETQAQLAATQRLGLRLQGFALRSYWIPGSWNVRMVYTDNLSGRDPSQESNGADQYHESDR